MHVNKLSHLYAALIQIKKTPYFREKGVLLSEINVWGVSDNNNLLQNVLNSYSINSYLFSNLMKNFEFQ